MKELTNSEIELINGGNVIDVACGVLAVADGSAGIAVLLGATMTPGVGWFLAISTLACAAYEMP